MKTVKELQEYVDKNEASLRYKELEEYVKKNLVTVPDPDDVEGWMKISDKKELTYRNFTDKEFEEHIKKTIQGVYDFDSTFIEMGIINILQHEGYPMELRTIAAEQYRADTISLLEQKIESRAFEIDFISLLSAYKPLFEEKVLNWYKRKTVHLFNRINDEPTDELYQSIIKDQYKAETELLINSNNPILPFYHERLTSLMANLDKRYAIAGGFKKWNDMYNYLTDKGYMNTTIEVFNSVMENKHLPIGENKVQWLTAQNEAIYIFMTIFNFEMKEINKCFISQTGTKFQLGSKSISKHKIKELEFVLTFLQK